MHGLLSLSTRIRALFLTHRLLMTTWVCLYACFAIVLGSRAFFIGKDLDLSLLVSKDSKALEQYDSARALFDLDEELIVLVRFTDKGEAAVLRNAEAVYYALSEIEDVREVNALHALRDAQIGASTLDFRSFVQVPEYHISVADWQTLQRYAFFRHSFIDKARSSLLFAVHFPAEFSRNLGEEEAGVARIDERLRNLQSKGALASYYFLGAPGIRQYIHHSQQGDFRVRIPIILVIIFAFLWWQTRSAALSMLGLATLFLSAAMSVGAMEVLGYKLNIYTNFLFIILLTLGTSDLLHVLLTYVRTDNQIRRAIFAIFWPCLLTLVTTAIGFLGLLATDMRIFAQLGLFASLGLCITFCNTLFFLPALIFVLRLKHGQAPRPRMFFRSWAHAVTRSAKLWGFASIACIALSIIGLSYVRYDADLATRFSTEHPLTQGLAHLHNSFGYSTTLDLVATHTGSMRGDPITPALLDKLASQLKKSKGVVDIVHAGDFTAYARDKAASLGNNAPAMQDLILRMLQHFGPLRHFAAENESQQRLQVFVEPSSVAMLGDLTAELQRQAARVAPDVQLTPAGDAALLIESTQAMRDNLLLSTFATTAVVFLLLAFFFRHVVIFGFLVLANIFPLLAVLGSSALCGFTLDLSILVTGSVGLGIAVDDTIHFLSHFQEHKRHMGVSDAIAAAFEDAGPAMLGTNTLLAACFAVLMTSSFNAAANMGLLFVVTFGFALAADMLFLPAWLIMAKRFITSANRKGEAVRG